MAELRPATLDTLVARIFGELERNGSVFDLPRRKFFTSDPDHDTSVLIHGRRVESPLGPAAGPHTQLAQNIVLGWLAGARVFELKTVQANDRIKVPRPCIDAGAVTINVEWSQELTLEQSLEEYHKAWDLIQMLGGEPYFDVSVGYDLAGITSDRVAAFLRGMRDIASSVTLSTFHGCLTAEIRRIAEILMEDFGFDCAIKLNPTLLGPVLVDEILHDRLGYSSVIVPPSAFEHDPTFEEAVEIVGSLRYRARSLGRHFAIKLTNTLVVENHSDFLPRSERFAYLSGAPLHVLAMHLVRDFRHVFGDSLPISFSAGIDRFNYPDAVRLGLAPVTVCTDLLKQGGYGRLHDYGIELARRMDAVGAHTIDEFREGASIDRYVASLDKSERYRADVVRTPRKTRKKLTRFDCATCDLCIPACPNGAFMRIPSLEMGTKSHQMATYADFCNECGNCERWCPEEGSPHKVKLRVFADGTAEGADADYVRRAVFDARFVNMVNCVEDS